MNPQELRRIAAYLRQLAVNPPPEVRASLRLRMARIRKAMPREGDMNQRCTR